MNDYTLQTIARQRMEETARNTRHAHRITRPESRTGFPRFSWTVVRHVPVVHLQRG